MASRRYLSTRKEHGQSQGQECARIPEGSTSANLFGALCAVIVVIACACSIATANLGFASSSIIVEAIG